MPEERDSGMKSPSSSSSSSPNTQSSDQESSQKTLRENIIRVALTSEARQRLANIKMVKPDIANIIEEYVVQLASSGRLKKTIDDEQLKTILSSLQDKKKEFKIRWI